MPCIFSRPVPRRGTLPTLLEEARRLEPFVPPFRFTSFFSPEDTLLCVLAAEAAQPGESGPILELAAGSGLIGLSLLARDEGARLSGIDIDGESHVVASANAELLGLGARSRFYTMDLRTAEAAALVKDAGAGLMICNPPYVPEPPAALLPVEAGAGPDGAAHVRRALELASLWRPEAVALSWCSLSDPAGIVREAHARGYALESLFVAAIADGEYSGTVHEYLRTLPTSFLSESPDTLRVLAPDGDARFSYLLMAGAFRKMRGAGEHVAAAIHALVSDFRGQGLAVLESPRLPCTTTCWMLDRWDELALRVLLHGEVTVPR